jgi:rubrerythrin
VSDTGSEMKQAIELAIYREIGARDFYRRIADQIKNAEGIEKFRQLSDDEEGHRVKLESWFKRLYETDFEADPEGIKQSEIGDYPIEKETGALEALDIAIEAEAKAQEYYTAQSEKAESAELREMFRSLADEERGHYNLLEAERNSLIGGFYWFDMDSTSFLED